MDIMSNEPRRKEPPLSWYWMISFLYSDTEGGCIEKRITLTSSGPVALMDAWQKWHMCQTHTQHNAPWKVARKKHVGRVECWFASDKINITKQYTMYWKTSQNWVRFSSWTILVGILMRFSFTILAPLMRLKGSAYRSTFFDNSRHPRINFSHELAKHPHQDNSAPKGNLFLWRCLLAAKGQIVALKGRY